MSRKQVWKCPCHEACSSHHQIVWICFWFCIWQTQPKYKYWDGNAVYTKIGIFKLRILGHNCTVKWKDCIVVRLHLYNAVLQSQLCSSSSPYEPAHILHIVDVLRKEVTFHLFIGSASESPWRWRSWFERKTGQWFCFDVELWRREVVTFSLCELKNSKFRFLI